MLCTSDSSTGSAHRISHNAPCMSGSTNRSICSISSSVCNDGEMPPWQAKMLPYPVSTTAQMGIVSKQRSSREYTVDPYFILPACTNKAKKEKENEQDTQQNE